MQGTKIKHSRIRITSVFSKENEGIGNIFSIDIIQIRLSKLLVGKMKLDFDCTTVVT